LLFDNTTPANSRIKILAINSAADLSNDTFIQAIKGYRRNTDLSFTPALPTAFTGSNNVGTQARVDSDILSTFYANTLNSTLLASNYLRTSFASNAAISIASNIDCIKNGELIMLSSPTNAHIIRITNTPTCSSSATTLSYDPGSFNSNGSATAVDDYLINATKITRFTQSVYYVANTNRNDANNQPIPALYRKTQNGTPEEILEGVEYIRMQFGVRLNDGNIKILNSTEMTDQDRKNIFFVRIGLLINDPTVILSNADTRSYTLPGVTINPPSASSGPKHSGGKGLRKVFISTYTTNSKPWG
jgi:type IV pilus assembly protein PilW